MSIYEQFEKIGIIPVVVLDDANDSLPLAKALIKGGMPAAEVTFRTPAAAKAIELMSQNCPDILVGAGTVLSKEQVDQALAAGAKFIVSPGVDPEVIKYCQSKNVPILPGCATPTDVQTCYALGLDHIKFFPAEPAGGIKMIKAIAAPYTMMQFMPTGGISEKNMEDYLKEKMIFCIGGSWMVKSDLIKNQDFEKIEELCKKAVKKLEEIRK